MDELNLSPATLAQIFAGTITKWNDDAIAADNPDADLPDTDITPVHRSDESGTTENFTDYLSPGRRATTGPTVRSRPGRSRAARLPTARPASSPRSTEGEGTIGYADASQAADLGHANIGVGADFVGPTPRLRQRCSTSRRRSSGRGANDIALDINRTTEAAGVYPIVLASYHIVCSTLRRPGDGRPGQGLRVLRDQRRGPRRCCSAGRLRPHHGRDP